MRSLFFSSVLLLSTPFFRPVEGVQLKHLVSST